MTHAQELHIQKVKRIEMQNNLVESIKSAVLGLRKTYHPDFIAIVVNPKIFGLLQTHLYYFYDYDNKNTFFATKLYVSYKTDQDFIVTTNDIARTLI